MVNGINISLSGDREIDAVLRGMPLQLTHSVLQAANAEAAKPLVDKAKALSPEGPTGRLIDSIGVVKQSIKKAGELGEVGVGPRRGRFGGSHAHLVERGTKVRRNEKGANRGYMPKHPFMEPAFKATYGVVLGRINDLISKKLVSFAKRTIKKYS